MLIAIVLVVGVLVAVLVPSSAREPVYQERPLRTWLEEFDQSYTTTNYAAAQEAIRNMGTNALPFLIRVLRSKDPPYYAQWIRLKARLLHSKVEYAASWHRRAATACGELGSLGAPAFPAMTEAMNDPHAAHE